MKTKNQISENIIDIRNLTKQFGDFKAVDDISFQVRRGEIFGFLGANGAGKTTAIKMLIGLSKPSDGGGEVAGFDIIKEAEMIKQHIGYMSQKFSLYEDISVIQNIQFYGGVYGLSKEQIKNKSTKILEDLNLHLVAKKLVSDLPLGWKQRLAFAISSVHNPAVIFMDEPTGGVDPRVRRQFWESIYEASAKGNTIFVTTHYMDEAEYCDRVSIMVEGKIAALDTPNALKEQFDSKSMDEVFLKLVR